jgi:outer membrane protein OmpA-like peptidoglycan-associated protein
MELQITNVTTNPQDEAKVKFHANLDDKGRMAMEVIIKPLAQPLDMETTFSLNDYALGVLTPYVGKYTGRELKSGKLDLQMDYNIGDNKLTASHKLLIQRFEFGNSVESKDALHLPFGLAVALLEDPQGKINIALPASGDMSDPKFQYTHLIFQVVQNFFINLVTKPFSILGSMLGSSGSSTDELGYVRFVPGKTDLLEKQKQKIKILIKSLKARPKLRLEIDGSYDPQVDWKAIQADIFTKDFKELRKESDRSDGKVYQLLYQRRFGIRALWALAKKYKKSMENYDDDKLDKEIKRQLIENAPPDQAALSVLAQARAKLVHDFFLSSGFDAERMSIGHPQSTQSSMGYVPLEFTLTVFDDVK